MKKEIIVCFVLVCAMVCNAHLVEAYELSKKASYQQEEQKLNLQSTGEYGNLKYYIDTDSESITIEGCDKEATSIIIPDKIDGYTVNTIGYQAFWGCTKLESIFIPDTIEYIEAGAFGDCKSLNTITINNNSTKFCIVDNVLYNKDKTKLILCPRNFSGTFKVPEGIMYIGSTAFDCCYELKGVEFPNTIRIIEDWGFSECTALSELNLNIDMVYSSASEDNATIGRLAYWGCTSLKKVKIVDLNNSEWWGSRLDIDDAAFKECTGLKSVMIMSDTEGSEWWGSEISIEDSAFQMCSKLQYVLLPEGIERISNYAFDDCNELTTIYYCGSQSAWNSIYISSSNELKKKEIIFDYDPYNTEQSIVGASLQYDSVNGKIISLSSSADKIVIPAEIAYMEVTSIADNAFINCECVKEITIPRSVKEISSGTFNGLENTVIKVYKDSYAYQYMKDNNIAHKVVSNINGDIYTDDVVNSKDSIRLAQHLAKWNVVLTEDEKEAADLYADGMVNSKDSIKLSQYLAKWNVSLE